MQNLLVCTSVIAFFLHVQHSLCNMPFEIMYRKVFFCKKNSHEYFSCFSSLSEKDSVRTDRNLEFFSDANMDNVYMLERVLKTFLILRPEMGEYKR